MELWIILIMVIMAGLVALIAIAYARPWGKWNWIKKWSSPYLLQWGIVLLAAIIIINLAPVDSSFDRIALITFIIGSVEMIFVNFFKSLH